MRENRKRLLLVLALLLLGPPAAVRAEVVTWAMEGTIQSVTDPLGLIGFAQVNEHVLYTFTFDLNTPDTNPTTTLATYLGTAATFAAGTTLLPAGSPWIEIQRYSSSHENDMFNVRSGLLVNGMSGGVYFLLRDPLGTGLTNTSLPSQPYPLGSFAQAEFSATIDGPPSPNNPTFTPLFFYGTVDAFYVIPEPCSLLCLALGGVMIAFRRK